MSRFHAAVPVSGNRILVCGGCSAIGALQDVQIINIGELVGENSLDIACFEHEILSPPHPITPSSDTNTWSSMSSPLLCSRPRAGHSVINLSSSAPKHTENKQRANGSVCCTLLLFGGSDCCGTFYNDTLKCLLEIPDDT